MTSSGCCRRPPVSPTPIRTVERPCLTEPFPTTEGVEGQILKGGEGWCPVQATGGCYTEAAALAIGAGLRYGRQADRKCRTPETQP